VGVIVGWGLLDAIYVLVCVGGIVCVDLFVGVIVLVSVGASAGTGESDGIIVVGDGLSTANFSRSEYSVSRINFRKKIGEKTNKTINIVIVTPKAKPVISPNLLLMNLSNNIFRAGFEQ